MEVIVEATIQINVKNGCDSDIEDPTTEAYLKLKQQFLISVKILLIIIHLYITIYTTCVVKNVYFEFCINLV